MKRILGLIIIMFTIYLGIQLVYTYFSKGYEIEYLKDGYQVKERYISRTKNETDSYYLEINVDNEIFEINTYKNYNKKKEIVKSIKSINSSNYKCIYVKLDNDIKYDILCKNNGITYNYYNIKGKDKDLDNKIKSLDYGLYNFTDTAKLLEKDTLKGVFVGKDNLIKNQYLAVSSYRGLYLINNYSNVKFLYEVNIFNKDIKDVSLSTYVGKNYLVADYNQNYTFDKFYLLKIDFGDVTEIKYHSSISFDSYIMGVVDSKVYLMDCDNKKQYEIDIDSKNIVEVGNEKLGIKFYENGEWRYVNSITVIKNKMKFNVNEKNINGYEKVLAVGGEKTGYLYYFKKNGKKYDVYRSMQTNNNLKYLFSLDNISNIRFLDDYVYYQDGENIYCYQDNIGNKKIFYYDPKLYKGTYNMGISY